MRSTWDETWVAVASAVALRSDCSVRQVGALVASADNRDHWVGYNGPPGGFQTPSGLAGQRGCENYCPQSQRESWGDPGASGAPCVSIHAEVNALMQSDRSLRTGGTIYVTAAPCWKCALAVLNSGVARLVCPPWEQDRLELALRVNEMFDRTPGKLLELTA